MANKGSEAVLRKAFAAYNRHDLDAYIEMLDPDYVEHDSLFPKAEKGREAYRRIVGDFFKTSPDFRVKILNIAAKDGLVAAEVSSTYTLRAAGVRTSKASPAMRRFKARMAMFARVNSKGLIAELRIYYYDPAGLLRQLGLKT